MIYRFGDCELDTDAFELKRGGMVRAVEPQVLELLRYLVENPNRLIGREELFDRVWSGRIVSDSTLSSRVKLARQAVGDDGRSQSLVRTVHGRGFRFVGQVEIGEASRPGPVKAEGTVADRAGADLKQTIQYCTTSDRVRIAYARLGQGRPIIKAANWMSHLEYDWESPIWRHWITGIARNRLLIRYDERGNGLSDREVADLSFDAMVADLESVADAQGLDRFALFGISQGCAVSVEYAVRHPERVSHVILYGGFVKGWRKQNDPLETGRREAMSTLIRAGWGQDNPAFRQLFTSCFMPEASLEQMAWFNELQRKTVSPDVAYRLHQTFGDIDVSRRLPRVTAPTLVLHARNDAEIPLEAGRAFATHIPGARFVTLESRNHILLEHEPAFARLIDEIDRFLPED